MPAPATPIPDFDAFLANPIHDWLSCPRSLHGWRVSGRNRIVNPPPVYHAGLDYLTFFTIYLEPVLGFLLDGEKPELVSTDWTPAQLTARYARDGMELALRATPAGPDGLLVRATVNNLRTEPASLILTAYGEADRRVDPEDSVDIDVQGQGYGKNFLEAAHRRLASDLVLAESIGDLADSHRGGLSDYPTFRVLRWHHHRTTGSVALRLPAGGQPADRPGQWRQEWPLSLAAGETLELNFALSARYQARRRLDLAEQAELADAARGLAREEYSTRRATNRDEWQTRLAQIEPPAAELPAELKQLYYRAWTCVWQLVTPGFDTGRIDGLRFPEACLLVTKADHRAVMPADWETGLGALLLAQVDPKLAAQILDGMMAAVEPDGYVPENLVNTKENMLPYITSYLQWEIYRRTGDREWLQKHWATQLRSFWAHYRNPNFKRRGRPYFRNLVYVHIGALYLHRIAVELNLPAQETEHQQWLVEETWQVVQNFWDEKRGHFSDVFNDRESDPGGKGFATESSVQSMVALFAGATDEQKKSLLADLRNKYLAGDYGLRESGGSGHLAQGVPLDEPDLSKVNTYKHSNFMFFIPGLAAADPACCREICWRTLRGIAVNGDFHEQMRCNMDRRAFGPMAVFGAFGYIICAQTLGRLGLSA